MLEAHDQLIDLSKFYVVTPATSVSTQLLLFREAVERLLENTIKLNRPLYREMNKVYAQYVDYLVTDVTAAMQTVDVLYAQVTKSFMTGEPSSEEIESLITQLESVADKLASFDTDPKATTVHAKQLFPKRLLSPECHATRKELNTTIYERIAWLSGFPSPSKFVARKDLRKESELRSLLSLMVSCMQAYEGELDNFSKLLLSAQLPEFSTSTVSMSQVVIDSKKMRTIQHGFVSGSMTKYQLTQEYLTVVDKQMLLNADKLVDDAKTVFTGLNT